jgi:hypothetical protein
MNGLMNGWMDECMDYQITKPAQNFSTQGVWETSMDVWIDGLIN